MSKTCKDNKKVSIIWKVKNYLYRLTQKKIISLEWKRQIIIQELLIRNTAGCILKII